MEIKVTITAEPALMALLENLGKTILIAGTDLREATEAMPKSEGIDFTKHLNPAPTSAPASASATAPSATAAPVPSMPVVPAATAPTPAPAAVVPTAPAHTYTLSELGVAGADLAASGKRDQLIALLQGFGVQALTQLPPERYPEFAQGLRALGAKI